MVTHPTTTSRCDEQHLRTWAESGMRSLTGPELGAGLGPPGGFLDKISELEHRIATSSAPLGRRVRLDGLGVLTARAATAGLHRRGAVSCGGATHLVRALDGWLALSLARPDDRDLVPAWLATDISPSDGTTWPSVHDHCRDRPVTELVDRAVMLGMPVAELGSAVTDERPPAAIARVADRSPEDRADRPVRVVDLSALWAGPLCGRVFAAAGADVLKVESTARPDGSRRGPAEFFELLDHGKHHLVVDLDTDEGVAGLRTVLTSADVVIESSRPRALEQVGIRAHSLLIDDSGPQVWISITGHGRDGMHGLRVAFGDDAAVAGGLVAWDDGTPFFCGDAVADPLAGLTAAAQGLEVLASEDRVLIDVSMAAVAAHFAGPTCPAGPHPARPPELTVFP